MANPHACFSAPYRIGLFGEQGCTHAMQHRGPDWVPRTV